MEIESTYRVKEKSYRFYYGWVIVAVSFFTLFVALGIRWSFGIFYVAMLAEYTWGRAETAGAFSVGMIVHGLFGPVTGTLIDRFGPRWLFPLGALFLSLGLLAACGITEIWHFYLIIGLVVGVGINTLSFSPHMSILPKWFIRKRGLATGIVLSGIGLGAMAFAPVVETMIDTIGWRKAFLALAGFVLFVVVPITALLQRRSPQEVGQHPDGVVPESSEADLHPPEALEGAIPSSNSTPQWTLKAAMCTTAFWWICMMSMCHGFLINMMVVHQVVHVVDVGYSKIFAASLLGIVGLLASIGGILSGSFSDRFGREIILTLGSGLAFIGIFILLLVRDNTSPWMLYAFVTLYGLGQGTLPPMAATATADLFPGNSLGRIFSIQTIGFGLGSGLGAYLGGFFYDRMGSYVVPFYLLLVSIVLAVFGIWKAGPRHRKDLSLFDKRV